MDSPEPNSTTPSDFLRYHVYKPDTQSFHKPRHAFYALNKPNPVLDNTDFPATGIVQLDHVVQLRHLADGPERNRVASELASLNSRIEAMEHLKMTSGGNSGAESGIIKSEPTGLIFYNPAIRKSVVKARVAAGHLPTLSVYGGRYYFRTPPQV